MKETLSILVRLDPCTAHHNIYGQVLTRELQHRRCHFPLLSRVNELKSLEFLISGTVHLELMHLIGAAFKLSRSISNHVEAKYFFCKQRIIVVQPLTAILTRWLNASLCTKGSRLRSQFRFHSLVEDTSDFEARQKTNFETRRADNATVLAQWGSEVGQDGVQPHIEYDQDSLNRPRRNLVETEERATIPKSLVVQFFSTQNIIIEYC